MAVESKELFVGGKVIVMRTDGEFDAFEALVIKKAVTGKSAVVIRLEHADQALKEHGAGWLEMVQTAEDQDDLVRVDVEQLYKPSKDVNAFIAEFRSLADARVEITKKMEALANRYSFHTAKKAHEAKQAKQAKQEATKK